MFQFTFVPQKEYEFQRIRTQKRVSFPHVNAVSFPDVMVEWKGTMMTGSQFVASAEREWGIRGPVREDWIEMGKHALQSLVVSQHVLEID
jgi:hypothetical protein